MNSVTEHQRDHESVMGISLLDVSMQLGSARTFVCSVNKSHKNLPNWINRAGDRICWKCLDRDLTRRGLQ